MDVGGPVSFDALLLVVIIEPGAEVARLADIYRRPDLGTDFLGEDVVAALRREGGPDRVNPVVVSGT